MKIYWLILGVLTVALLAGCGGEGGSETVQGTQAASAQGAGSEGKQAQAPKKDPRDSGRIATVYVAMDGWDSAETVSMLMAEKLGYFKKKKIYPVTLSPVTPKLTIPDVIEGQDAIGVAHGPEAVAARDKGAPIVIVGNVLQQSTAAFIWTKESGIKGIADLKGKTVAIPGLNFQSSFLNNVLTEGGLAESDVNVISVGNDLVPALLKGRADAIFGGSAEVEGVNLASHGQEPVVTPVTDLGVPDYDELVLVARRNVAEENPSLMKDFVKAVAHGAYVATDKPDIATKALVASGESDPEINPSAMEEQVKATVGKLSDSGYVDPARFQHLIDWMYENEMISEAYSVEELLPEYSR
jgi:putative hydroxymethylpyrimidine transport system substrate-binding protein